MLLTLIILIQHVKRTKKMMVIISSTHWITQDVVTWTCVNKFICVIQPWFDEALNWWMIYCIECDWQKMPKEETIGIMDIRGATFYFMFFYFSYVFVVYNLWVLVCVLHGMLLPISRIGDGTLFQGFSFIVKTRMRWKDWQGAWWWMVINIIRRKKLNTIGFKFIFLILCFWFYYYEFWEECLSSIMWKFCPLAS
jgi:hypothetical protein